MKHVSTERIGIIADDFTGAIDAGVEFVRAGFDTTLVIKPNNEHTSQVEVISTDSRDGDAATARIRATDAATQMQGRRVFKKIDSTMRGHLAAEITAILHVLGQAKAVVCPAAIEARRTVRAGQVWVGDCLLHHSDFARDPRWPASTADMSGLLGVPTTHIPMATVRAGADLLAAAVFSAPTEIVTADACDQADLDVIGQAIVLSDSLPCGALGLARSWARCQIKPTSRISEISAHRDGPLLIVAGSGHPRTRAQVHYLLAHSAICVVEASVPLDARRQEEAAEHAFTALSAGIPTLIRNPGLEIGGPVKQSDLVASLDDLTWRVCQKVRPGALLLTGGETASGISHRLGALGVRILGELEVGVPWGNIIGGIASGSLLVTKAGGFGSEEVFAKVADLLR